MDTPWSDRYVPWCCHPIPLLCGDIDPGDTRKGGSMQKNPKVFPLLLHGFPLWRQICLLVPIPIWFHWRPHVPITPPPPPTHWIKILPTHLYILPWTNIVTPIIQQSECVNTTIMLIHSNCNIHLFHYPFNKIKLKYDWVYLTDGLTLNVVRWVVKLNLT